MAQYYYLLSSLPELQPAQTRHTWDLGELLNFILEQLTDRDRALFWYLLYPNDNRRLLAAMARRHHLPHPVRRDLRPTALPTVVLQNYHLRTDELPAYMQDFVEAYEPRARRLSYAELTRALTTRFYAATTTTGNALVSGYYALDREIRHLTAMLTARHRGEDPAPHLLPGDDTRLWLRKGGEPEWEQVLFGAQAWAEAFRDDGGWRLEDLGLRRRWAWLDEHTLFDPFGTNAVLAYYLQLTLLHRRHRLVARQGRARLDRLVEKGLADIKPQ